MTLEILMIRLLRGLSVNGSIQSFSSLLNEKTKYRFRENSLTDIQYALTGSCIQLFFFILLIDDVPSEVGRQSDMVASVCFICN